MARPTARAAAVSRASNDASEATRAEVAVAVMGLGSLECARRSAGRLKGLAEIEEIKKRRPS